MRLFHPFRARVQSHRRALRRRWYIAPLVLVVLTPLLLGAFQAKGIYYAKVDVLFLPPPNTVGGNSLRADPGGTVYYAAYIERIFEGGEATKSVQSTNAPLYGTGMSQGHAVYVPNGGGQWQASFNTPVIRVEVVDSSPAAVIGEVNRIVSRIEAISAVPQKRLGIEPGSFITTELSPSKPAIQFVAARRSAAVGSVALLMAGMALIVPIFVDKLLLRLSARRSLRIPDDSAPLS